MHHKSENESFLKPSMFIIHVMVYLNGVFFGYFLHCRSFPIKYSTDPNAFLYIMQINKNNDRNATTFSTDDVNICMSLNIIL